MKKIYTLMISLIISQILSAQTGSLEALFEKYSEKEGFTSVYISGKMLNMLGAMNRDPDKADNILLRLKSIRILSEKDSLSGGKENFHNELGRILNRSEYEELMLVREGSDLTRFLVRQKGDIISELLMITKGRQGNSVVSIKGEINLRELADLSRTLGIENLEHLNTP
ncbi:MAG TPA: DUF4252 domain-containing protein [Bacteroidales bacterium]|jgi:hypothetical protein|nr:DUF4252 domain-containing protein [Bacteroidales bacterium]HOS73528.1 DUF4252 domain-containing protein [Bacteroidales bacterium]HQH25634.1 DUF4252 domain-containing protein [Bacteroidales bacterium]HQJ81924.1 DUF4252 domain-containing protein [Bacteroidales bacterium]